MFQEVGEKGGFVVKEMCVVGDVQKQVVCVIQCYQGCIVVVLVGDGVKKGGVFVWFGVFIQKMWYFGFCVGFCFVKVQVVGLGGFI